MPLEAGVSSRRLIENHFADLSESIQNQNQTSKNVLVSCLLEQMKSINQLEGIYIAPKSIKVNKTNTKLRGQNC